MVLLYFGLFCSQYLTQSSTEAHIKGATALCCLFQVHDFIKKFSLIRGSNLQHLFKPTNQQKLAKNVQQLTLNS